MTDELSSHIEAVARRLWGEPNPRLSRRGVLRWGKQGSKSADLEKGVWFDHEAGEGGGVLDLVARETGRRGAEGVAWLEGEVGLIEVGGRFRAKPHTRDSKPHPEGEVREIVARYPYRDADGKLLFEVVRYQPKDFRKRQPRPGGRGWIWSGKGVPKVPYRLPELTEALAMGRTVFLTEGEKDADALIAAGIAASCNAGGAGGWNEALSPYFAGADVVLLGDNDAPGRAHVQAVGAALRGVAWRVRVLDLPPLAGLERLPAKGDVSDWLAAGGVAADLPGLAERLGRDLDRAGPPESRFAALPWSRLDEAPPRGPWLVEDLMFSGDHGLCYGESQSGKSFLAVDLAMAIAQGKPFLGMKTRPGAVLYQAGEGGLGLVTRLKAYRRHHGAWEKDLPFVLLPARVDLFDPRGNLEAFLDEVAGWRAWFGGQLGMDLALVVVDTLATATPGANENASEDVSLVLANLERVRAAAGCATLLVHHKNAAGDRPRGHTSLYANADLALEITRDRASGARTLRVAKVKDGADGREVEFVLRPVELGVDEDGKAVSSCVVAEAAEGRPATSPRTSAIRLSSAKALYLRLLDEAISELGGLLPPSKRIPHNMEGVDQGAFRDLYAEAAAHGQSERSIDRALQRGRKDLQADGLVGAHENWLWITDQGRARL